MKYLLVEVEERNIKIPEIFDSYENAHDNMCENLADVLDVPKERIVESFLQGEEYDGKTCITEYGAWTERFGSNFDWKIFVVDDFGRISQ